MSFPSATTYFIKSEGVSLEAVEDDHTEEIESLEASFEVDDRKLTGQLRSVATKDDAETRNAGETISHGPGPSNLAISCSNSMDYNLKKASARVIVSST
jgi:hypothetical protein